MITKQNNHLFSIALVLFFHDAHSGYIKDMDGDFVDQELSHYYKSKPRPNLLKSVAETIQRDMQIEGASSLHDGFLQRRRTIMKSVGVRGHFTHVKGDIGYDSHTRRLISSYFKRNMNGIDPLDVKDRFERAIEALQDHKTEKDLRGILSDIEFAAESGYISAIVAYGLINQHGLLGVHRNVALAEAFFKVAASGNSTVALGHLAQLRKKHMVLGSDLKETLFLNHDHMVEMQLLRAASIGGGGLAYEFADTYRHVLEMDVRRDRARILYDLASKSAMITGKVASSGIKLGAQATEHVIEKTGEVAVKTAVTGVKAAIAA